MKNNSISNRTGSLTIDNGAASDAQINWYTNAAIKLAMGVDEDVGDSFKLSLTTTSIGTADALVLTTSGERLLPMQPAFMSYIDPGIASVTGAGTVYTIVWNNTQYDQAGDWDGTTFTAPIDGAYTFRFVGRLSSLVAGNTRVYNMFNTTNLTYSLNGGTAGPLRDPTTNAMGNCFSATLPMDALDTCVFQVAVFNNGTDNASFGTPNNPGLDSSAWCSGILEL